MLSLGFYCEAAAVSVKAALTLKGLQWRKVVGRQLDFLIALTKQEKLQQELQAIRLSVALILQLLMMCLLWKLIQ